MKKIKFRGKDIQTGKFIYGDLNHYRNNIFVDDVRVDPETVAQFVCYDASGEEIYEGDKLIDAEDGYPVNSLFVGIIDSDANAIDGELGDKFDDIYLYEKVLKE